VYFVSSGTVWKIPVEGGEPTQVIADGSIYPALSPKGESLLYSSLALGKVFIAPIEGGAPLKSFDVRGGRYSSSEFSWKSDGRALTFLWVRDNVSNLWEQPLDGSEPRQLTNFTAPGISKYAFSPDGKQLAMARMNVISDVVLINDLK
jgi:Tol biopolymer transport system component